MARLRALAAGGFALSSGYGDKQQVFRVNTLGGEVWIPDYIVTMEKAKIDSLIAGGKAEFVADVGRQGPRLLTVDPALLYSSATPVPIDLQGEPVQAVVFACSIAGPGHPTLGEGAVRVFVLDTDYSVTNGDVVWLGDYDASGDTAALFFVE